MSFIYKYRTHNQMLSLVITPMLTGSISFISSATLIAMILRSNLKLSTVYRRLIFGISVFDLIQSVGQGLSSIPMPVGSSLGAFGNDISCDVQGVLVIIGCTGSLLYSISLSIYFLSMIRNQTSERGIRDKLERYLHAVPILFTFVTTVVCLVFDQIHPHGTVCTLAATPMYCHHDLDVECEKPRRNYLISCTFVAAPLFTALIWNTITMGLIWRTEYLLAKKNQKYRSGWLSSGTGTSHSDIATRTTITITDTTSSQSRPTTSSLNSGRGSRRNEVQSPLAARLSRPSAASRRRQKEITRRGIAYIICSLLTYIFVLIFRIWGFSEDYPPFVLELLRNIFLPLQGLFNVIIYTYPHVISCKRSHPEYSWIRTFWEVIRSGGDSDQMMASQRNRSIFSRRAKKRKSVRNEPVVIDYDMSLASPTVGNKEIKKDTSTNEDNNAAPGKEEDIFLAPQGDSTRSYSVEGGDEEQQERQEQEYDEDANFLSRRYSIDLEEKEEEKRESQKDWMASTFKIEEF